MPEKQTKREALERPQTSTTVANAAEVLQLALFHGGESSD